MICALIFLACYIPIHMLAKASEIYTMETKEKYGDDDSNGTYITYAIFWLIILPNIFMCCFVCSKIIKRIDINTTNEGGEQEPDDDNNFVKDQENSWVLNVSNLKIN